MTAVKRMLDAMRQIRTAEPILLTMGDAAKLLDVSVRRVSLLVRAGILTPVRVGRDLRFRRADLDEYVANLPKSA